MASPVCRVGFQVPRGVRSNQSQPSPRLLHPSMRRLREATGREVWSALGHIRNALCAVVGTLCLFVVAPLPADQMQALREHMQKGVAHLQHGDSQAAEQEFRYALQINPAIAELHDLLGVSLDRQGKHDSATGSFLKAIEINPRYPPAHHHLGVNYIHLHRLDQAHRALATSLELDPNQPAAHNNLGNIYVQDQQYSLALDTFQTAHRLDPTNPHILFNLLRTEFRLGDMDAAALHADAMLRLSNLDVAMAVRLGRELIQYEQFASATAAYEHALALNPGLTDIHYDLARSYFRTHQFDASLRALERMADVSGEDANYFMLAGLNHREKGDLGRAVLYLRRALGQEPRNPDHTYNLGITLLRTDGIPEAHALFLAAVERFPSSSDLLYGAGVASFHLGLHEEAHRFFQDALQLDPHKAQYHGSLGDVYSATGQYAQAEGAYNQAIDLDPSNTDYLLKAGRNYFNLQLRDRAASAFQEAAEKDSSIPEAHLEIGKIAASRGDYQSAASYLERAVSLDPELRAAYYQLGLTYRRLGQVEKAAAALDRYRQLE